MKTGPNRSTAVMQRRVEPHDSLDDFPTAPWATRAVIEKVLFPELITARSIEEVVIPDTAWEPCCNRGFMANPMSEYFGKVWRSDIMHYGWSVADAKVCDFLFANAFADQIVAEGLDWIFFNPPFRLARQFIERAMALQPHKGIAVFTRVAFLEGRERYKKIFADNPPTIVVPFAERVSLFKGRCLDPDRKYWDPDADEGRGKYRFFKSATAYCWLIWLTGKAPRAPIWIPPCRKALTRPGDYDTDGMEPMRGAA